MQGLDRDTFLLSWSKLPLAVMQARGRLKATHFLVIMPC